MKQEAETLGEIAGFPVAYAEWQVWSEDTQQPETIRVRPVNRIPYSDTPMGKEQIGRAMYENLQKIRHAIAERQGSDDNSPEHEVLASS
jgi:hypothetical protein